LAEKFVGGSAFEDGPMKMTDVMEIERQAWRRMELAQDHIQWRAFTLALLSLWVLLPELVKV
jgi:hypothetical protein